VELNIGPFVCRRDMWEKSMRKLLVAVSLAAALGLLGVSGAGAVPADATAIRQAAIAASPLQQAFVGHPTRHGVVKCYRTLVVGPYRCHYFRRPW
jgi:hypothetical protein